MNRSVPQKIRVLQPWDHSKDALLLRVGQTRLKTNQVVSRAVYVFSAQLHHSVRPTPCTWIGKAYGFHWAKGQYAISPIRHHFNWQTAFKVFRLFKRVRFHFAACANRMQKRVILFLVHRTVDVVTVALIRTSFYRFNCTMHSSAFVVA